MVHFQAKHLLSSEINCPVTTGQKITYNRIDARAAIAPGECVLTTPHSTVGQHLPLTQSSNFGRNTRDGNNQGTSPKTGTTGERQEHLTSWREREEATTASTSITAIYLLPYLFPSLHFLIKGEYSCWVRLATSTTAGFLII